MHLEQHNLSKIFENFRCLDYIASPGIVIPLIVLMTLIIYYMASLAGSLREVNNDLKVTKQYAVHRASSSCIIFNNNYYYF